ncbi:MAG: pyruvate dehydrogenase (acetyl-transferring) E1 component subunit alpha [Deltaproteobacteria bacterium]|nr:pyruvate dehydrogenase (acetyl-transferring) E1 component subunit alpha [Deltaproteobacteria bacterium]
MYFDAFDPLRGERLEILDKEGAVREELRPPVSDEEIKRLYVRLTVMRAADRTALHLQREGRMGTYAPVWGQEACQASAAVLREGDWLVPSYREMGAMMLRGVPLATIYRYWMGDEWGNALPEALHVLPVSIPVGSQPLHAVGIAWAQQLRKQKAAVLVYFGDGASSEGEVHEAMNFAGVFRLPVVFFCQNNHFAISVPRSRQSAARTIAQRALGYGFPGLQLYGNDLLAVWGAVNEALEEAREGKGPKLIEALTYRFGPHTTADDPTQYRSEEEVARNLPYDPLLRLRVYLKARGLWSEEEETEIVAAARAEVEQAVAEAESGIRADPSDLFDYTYETLTPCLARQKAEFLAAGRFGQGGSHG